MKKSASKDIAKERIRILIDNALHEASCDQILANSHSKLAKKIGMRMRVRHPYDIRQLYCKSCKQFIVPGINSRVRIGRSQLKAIRITCLNCGHIYRKIIVN